jgi:hypothetical protein
MDIGLVPKTEAAPKATIRSIADVDRYLTESQKGFGTQIKESLFGKKMEAPMAEPSIRAEDPGVVGRLWRDFMLAPTGTGKTLGEVKESIFNPVGRTNIQQQRVEDLQEKAYQQQYAGRGVAVRAAASLGTGVGRFVEGQTSPFQLALLFAGPAKAVAAEGAAGVFSPKLATLGKLAHFGFTSQMAMGAVDDSQQAVQEFRGGNWEKGIQLSVDGMVNALFAVSGTTHARAEETVRRSLESNSRQIYKSSWTKLTPEQKSNVVYEATRKMPFYRDLEKNVPSKKIYEQMAAANKAYSSYIEHAQEEGLRPPPGGEPEKLQELLLQKQASDADRATGNAFLGQKLDEEVARRAEEHRIELEKEHAAYKASEDAKREEEVRAKEEPPVTVVDRRSVSDAVSPQEREEVQASARHVLEEERARRMREKEEAGIGVTDRRSAAELNRTMQEEVEQRGKLETPAGQRYAAAHDRLTEMSEQIFPGAGPETVYERLRRKQREGFNLSREEEGFLGLHAQRETFERELLRDTKLRGATAADRQERNLDSLRTLAVNAERETDLQEASRTLRDQAGRAKSPDEADSLAKESLEAQEMAERLRTERSHEQIRRSLSAQPPEAGFEPLGAPVARLEGKNTWVDLPDGRALPAQYGAVRLSDLIRGEAETPKLRAGQYDPGFLVSNDTAAQYGPLTVLKDGRVMNGVRRLGMLEEALRGPDRDRILNEVEGQLWRFGIETGEGLDRSDPYVPVRILDAEPEDAQSVAILRSDLDRTTPIPEETELPSGVDKQKLPSGRIDTIVERLKEMPSGSTLGDLLSSREGHAILDEMVSEGVLDQHSAEEFLTESGELTEPGKSLLERIILGRAVDDQALLREMPQSVTDKLTYALPGLARLQEGPEDWQIGSHLKRALRDWAKIDPLRTALNEVGNPRDSIVDKFYRPHDYRLGGLIFQRRPAAPHPIREALARLFEQPHDRIETAFNDYADAMEARQDTHQSPNEAFNRQIGDRFEIEVLPQEWETAKPLPPSERAAIKEQEKPKPKVKPQTKEVAARKALVPPPPAPEPEAARPAVSERALRAPSEAQQDADRAVLESAIENGAVTPESLRKFFESDSRTKQHADLLMDIFSRVIPGAHNMSLEEYLADKISDFRRNPELAQKGATQFLDDGRVLIELGPKADVSTVLHEWFHAMHKYLSPEDRATIANFVGAEDPDLLSREHYEEAARAFEKYLASGKAPLEELETTFGKLKGIFRKIYEGIRNSPLSIRLSKEMRETFDRWFGLEAPAEEMQPLPEEKIKKPPNLREAEDLVWQKHEELEPQKDIPLSMFRLREASGLPEELFDEAIHSLRKQHRLFTTPYDKQEGAVYSPEHENNPMYGGAGWLIASTRRPEADWLPRSPEDLKEVSEKELAPPPESLTTITPEELEKSELKIKLNSTPLQERMAEARAKSFPDLDTAKAWMINNKGGLTVAEARQTPEGDVFVHFIPETPGTLFQEEPKSLGEMVRHVERLKKERERIGDPERRRILDREIGRWEGKIGTPEFGLFAPPTSEARIAPPPEDRPAEKPGQSLILFPEEISNESRRAADQRRAAVDDAARLQNAERAERLATGAERPQPIPADRPSLPGVSRPAAGTARVEERRNSFNRAGDVRVEPPQRLRTPAIVNSDQWRTRMIDLRMPEGLPAPSYKISDTTAALLSYPGQREIVESTMSTLQQFDGTVIATPTGTGKTFTALGVIKESFDPAKDRMLILTTSQEIIRQRNGWKDAGKRFFNLDVKDMPTDFTKAVEPGIYVTTYDTLMRRYNAGRYPWKMVIADESDEARNWWSSKTGRAVMRLSDASEKVVYLSATPFHLVQEYGYMTKLGLWKPNEFESFAKQFGARKTSDGRWIGGADPKQLIRLRKVMVERGQFVTMDKSYDGYSAQFAMVGLKESHVKDMRNAVQAFTEAERWFKMRGQSEKARAVRGVATTYLKNYLERSMLPQTIEMMKEARRQGWFPQLYVENLNERNDIYEFLEPVDKAMGGRLSQLLPPLPGVYEELVKAVGEEQIANFTGLDSPERRKALEDHNSGKKPFMLVTYGAGGRGVNTHDTSGVRPRMQFILGPPWSGMMLDQAVGRPWRYGTKSNVQAVFMATNAKPHVNMIAGKIAPRLESLRAAVSGVDGTDPLVRAMRDLRGAREELASFNLGGGQENKAQDFLQLDNRIPIKNYKEIKIDSAEGAKNKGMKYPGQVDDQPGVITLFQEEGKPKLPERFVSPEEAKAILMTREMMQSLADGENLPVAGEELNAITPGERKILADTVGPVVEASVEKPGEGDKSAIARQEAGNEITRILAAKRIGDVEATPQGWEMKVETPAAEAPKPEEGHVAPLYWMMSGRLNMERVTRQANVPEIGKELKRMHDDYLVRAHNYAGDFTHRFLQLMKESGVSLKGEEFRNFWLAKEGKAPPANARIAKAVEAATKLFEEAHREAAERGIYLKDWQDGKETKIYFEDFTAKPDYMPHRYSDTEKIRVTDPETGEKLTTTWGELTGGKIQEDRRKRIIAGLRKQSGMTAAQVEDWLQNRRRRVPLAGNIERARKADMPGYRMDAGAVLDYFHDLGEVLARQEVFGQDREKLDGVIARVPSAKGIQVLNTIFDGLLKPKPMDERTARWYSLIANTQVLSKMAFSAAKVPGHLALYPVVMEDFASLTRALFGFAFNFREMQERAIAAGALTEYAKSASMLEHSASLNLSSKFLGGVGFNWFYKMDRIVTNGAARSWMERYALPKLMENSKRSAHIRDQLRDKLMLSNEAIDAAIQRKRWTEQDLNRGSVAVTNRTLFTSSPAELPPNWRVRPDDPVAENMAQYLRVATILKGFTFKIANSIKENIIDEARKGNYRPIAYALVSFPAAAEAIKALSATAHTAVSAATGGGVAPAQKYLQDWEDLFDDPTVGKFIKRYVDDLGIGTAQEILSNYFDTLLFPNKNKRIARYREKQLIPDTVDWLIGPYSSITHTIQTAFNVISAATIEEGDKRYQKAAKAILDWGKKEIPAARPALTRIEQEAGLQSGFTKYPMAR